MTNSQRKRFRRAWAQCLSKTGHESIARAISAATRSTESAGFQIYVYKCNRCQLYHLTSHPRVSVLGTPMPGSGHVWPPPTEKIDSGW